LDGELTSPSQLAPSYCVIWVNIDSGVHVFCSNELLAEEIQPGAHSDHEVGLCRIDKHTSQLFWSSSGLAMSVCDNPVIDPPLDCVQILIGIPQCPPIFPLSRDDNLMGRIDTALS